jgi:hypothetical protein
MIIFSDTILDNLNISKLIHLNSLSVSLNKIVKGVLVASLEQLTIGKLSQLGIKYLGVKYIE